MAPFVGVLEIVCGTLILLGLLTRLAAVPLIIDMLVAISTTKISILIKSGFRAMAHEARVDYAMLLGSIFLLIVGAGTWSLGGRLGTERKRIVMKKTAESAGNSTEIGLTALGPE